MLSTAMKTRMAGSAYERYLMKPAYENHPCTRWVGNSPGNAYWLCQMAKTLEKLRDSTRENAATPVVRMINDWLEDNHLEEQLRQSDPFIFCGPKDIAEADFLTLVGKYRVLYIRKQDQWQGTSWAMSYKGRCLPEFLNHLAPAIEHTLQADYWNDEELINIFCEA